MAARRNFIERDIFETVMRDVTKADGTQYHTETVYGDLSRLVVAWLACTPVEELSALYTRLGWKSNPEARAFHLAARRWLELYQPGRCPVVTDPV